jgi:hypothetical protein
MPNYAANCTIFVGPKAALDRIASAITDKGEFDFNKLHPTPAVLEVLSAPVTVVSDNEFTEEHGLDHAPATINELIAFTNEGDYPYGLHNVPQTVYNTIIKTHTYGDWYDWRVAHWGTKWTGRGAEATRFHDNLLIVIYSTAWAPPTELFSHLRANCKGLHIINGVSIEDFSDGIDASDGGLTSFLTYFTTSSSIEIAPYDFSHLPGFADASEKAKRGVDLYHSEQCEINTDNIDTLMNSGYLVGENTELIRIADIESAA